MKLTKTKHRLSTIIIAVAVTVCVLATGTVAAQDVTVSSGDSIQDAVDNASPGDTIEIEAGTFPEQVIVNKSLTIRGQGDSTVIEAPDSLDVVGQLGSRDVRSPFFVNGTTGIEIADLKVDGRNKGSGGEAFFGIYVLNTLGTISDVTVTNTTQGPDSRPSGNQVNDGIRVRNEVNMDLSFSVVDSTFKNFDKRGIRMESLTSLEIDVRRNRVIGAGVTNRTAQNGISLAGTGDSINGTVENNVVRSLGYSVPPNRPPVVASYVSAIEVSDMTISGNDLIDTTPGAANSVGVFLTRSENTTFADNTVEDQSTGAVVSGGSGATLSGNEFRGHTTGEGFSPKGILLSSTSSYVITDNLIEDSTSGIVSGNSADGEISGNRVRRNTADGLLLDNSTGNDVFENFIENNGNGTVVRGNFSGNTFTDQNSRNNDVWDFVAEPTGGTPNPSPISRAGVNIGESTKPDTIVSFDSNRVLLRSLDDPEEDPENLTNIGRYFEAESLSGESFLNVSLSYEDADVSGVNESTLSLFRFNGTEWEQLPNSTVDTANNLVSANITEFSDFGAFAEPAPGDGIGGCIDRRDLGRGLEDQECPFDRGLSRGGSREEIDRKTGRGGDDTHRDSATSRRDRSRGERRSR